MSDIPCKHAQSLWRRPLLAFSIGTYYWGLRLPTPRLRQTGRPLYRQSRQSLPIAPTVWAGFGDLLTQKTKLPRFSTVCSGKPDTMLSLVHFEVEFAIGELWTSSSASRASYLINSTSIFAIYYRFNGDAPTIIGIAGVVAISLFIPRLITENTTEVSPAMARTS